MPDNPAEPPPILEFDATPTAIINAADWHQRIDGAPTRGVLTWMRNAHDALVAEHGTGVIYEMPLESNTFTVHGIDWHGTPIALALTTVGAPVAAALLETMIAIGCTDFVTIGSSGGLVADNPPGAVVVAEHLIRDEGTSYHYAPAEAEVRPDPAIRDALIAAFTASEMPTALGGLWTTDAFYRETAERVARRVAAGAIAVDMEASALAAVANFRNVRLASAVYLADTLHNDRWDPTDLVEKDAAYRTRLLSIALDAIASIDN